MQTLRRFLPPILALLIVAITWEILVTADTSDFRIVPKLSEVITALFRTAEPLITRHIPQTLLETFLGLLWALGIGIGLAVLLDFFPLVKRALYPLLVLSQTIPVFAIAPLLILIFDFGMGPKIVTVALFCFFPITVAMIDGLSATDPDLIALLRAMGASRMQIWRKVRFPSALPSFFSGLRIAATYSVTGAIVGEFITAQQGLGRYLRDAYNSSKLDQGFAAILVTAGLSILLVLFVSLIERLAIPWFYSTARRAHWDEPGIY